MRHLWIAMLLGCGDSESDNNSDTPVEEVTEETESSTLEETVVGEGDIEPAQMEESRSRMRMNIDQLQASMKHITGVDWMSGNKLLWDEFRTSLGVPDYQETVSEDLSANVIFQKFLQDAATYSCQQWREHDGTAGPYAFFGEAYDETDPETVVENLRYLRRLVHGHFEDGEDPMIESLRELYTLVYQRTQDRNATWNTVCVALFTHPDFYTY